MCDPEYRKATLVPFLAILLGTWYTITVIIRLSHVMFAFEIKGVLIPLCEPFSECIGKVHTGFLISAEHILQCHYHETLFQRLMKIQWWISFNSLWNLNLRVTEVQCYHRALCVKQIGLCEGLTSPWQSIWCLIRKCSTLCEVVCYRHYKS